MKNLKNLGSLLSKAEQKIINGGICKCKIRIPTHGRTMEYSNDRCCGSHSCPPC